MKICPFYHMASQHHQLLSIREPFGGHHLTRDNQNSEKYLVLYFIKVTHHPPLLVTHPDANWLGIFFLILWFALFTAQYA